MVEEKINKTLWDIEKLEDEWEKKKEKFKQKKEDEKRQKQLDRMEANKKAKEQEQGK